MDFQYQCTKKHIFVHVLTCSIQPKLLFLTFIWSLQSLNDPLLSAFVPYLLFYQLKEVHMEMFSARCNEAVRG